MISGIYGTHNKNSPRKNYFSNGIIRSLNGGESWKYVASLCDDPDLGDEGPNELDVVRLSTGELLALFRIGGRDDSTMRQCFSNTDGSTWSEPEDTGIPGISPQLTLLPNDVLVRSFGRRTRGLDNSIKREVVVMIDKSGTGRHWSDETIIYDGSGSGYTDVQVLSRDRFRIVFDQSSFGGDYRPGGNQIVRVEISTL